ncbi:MAG: bifunctional diaminohydroxyphosphoribosylaminopyrimidine deaminase/5-amino-6-(5-phosphoribosylamino)uracil reductase RibD [Gammaproteobacteria bacterium]|nr:bifunctional diaminohydroxyphosphoribosylaminopyrimidine deaminase/5-amino-6-(5-phosphoribosylamino)uracil reductase RibD [Gammaproteobacteria bacterium]
MNQKHTEYMLQALQLAKEGRFSVSPNPMVGCLIVKDDRIIGKGFHQFTGGPHAEVYALEEAGDKAKGATVYLTLEPCAHHGKTPPCINALLHAGITKVFIACLDPNPLVCGKGIATLRSQGVTVEVGLCQKEAEELNEIFFYYITHKRPYIISKWAMSLDGKTITHADDERQISSTQSHHHAHDLRRSVDAILVGANTIRTDDPQLTARLCPESESISKQPIRIILSTSGNLSPLCKIFDPALPGKTIIVSAKKIHPEILINPRVENLVLRSDPNGLINISLLLDELGKRQITSILIEGGMNVHQQFFQENLVNKINVYLSPTIIGTLYKKQHLDNLSFSMLGRDLHLVSNSKGNLDV